VAGVGDEGDEDVEDGRDAAGGGVGRCLGGWGCSGHGLVVAGLGEQSKNFGIGLLMRGYGGWGGCGSRGPASRRATCRDPLVRPGAGSLSTTAGKRSRGAKPIVKDVITLLSKREMIWHVQPDWIGHDHRQIGPARDANCDPVGLIQGA
jgi:hypothetical protein